MAYTKVDYTRINWVNKQTSKTTPIGASNLNIMDEAISELAANQDSIYTDLETVKKKYQSVLDDIYEAIVSRGLFPDKEDIASYADEIRKLKKVDLEFAFAVEFGDIDVSNTVAICKDLADGGVTSALLTPQSASYSESLSSDNLLVEVTNSVTIVEDLTVELEHSVA